MATLANRALRAMVSVLVLLAMPIQAQAQQALRALVVGNDAYANAPLKNARNDARSMAAALTDLGFEVDLVTDSTQRGLEEAIERFVAGLKPGTTALTFYAGHGVQIDGDNYLLPIDFEARDETEARYRAYSASRLYDRVAGKGVGLQIMILDACRDNPYRASRSATRGLAPMNSAQKGSLVAFSTAPGAVASDNPHSINSVFTTQLIQEMFSPGINLDALFLRVRQNVNRITNGRQIPWTNSSLCWKNSHFAPARPPRRRASLSIVK